jgi:hypothetical protein
MQKSLLVIGMVVAAAFLATEALADHTQNISATTAESLCKSGGYAAGTTTCGFCHSDHCHTVFCDKDNKNCKNEVTTPNPQRTTRKNPIGSGATPVGNASTQPTGLSPGRPPVTTTGVHPITTGGTTGRKH